MNTGSCTPSEPEQTNRNTERAYKRGWETIFRPKLPVGSEFGLEPEVEIPEEGRDYEDVADEDPKKGETIFGEIEAVDTFEDDGEGFEPDVEEAIN